MCLSSICAHHPYVLVILARYSCSLFHMYARHSRSSFIAILARRSCSMLIYVLVILAHHSFLLENEFTCAHPSYTCLSSRCAGYSRSSFLRVIHMCARHSRSSFILLLAHQSYMYARHSDSSLIAILAHHSYMCARHSDSSLALYSFSFSLFRSSSFSLVIHSRSRMNSYVRSHFF